MLAHSIGISEYQSLICVIPFFAGIQTCRAAVCLMQLLRMHRVQITSHSMGLIVSRV